MTGLELLEGIRSGAVPPPGLAVTLGLTMEEIDAGRVVFGLEPGGEHRADRDLARVAETGTVSVGL